MSALLILKKKCLWKKDRPKNQRIVTFAIDIGVGDDVDADAGGGCVDIVDVGGGYVDLVIVDGIALLAK